MKTLIIYDNTGKITFTQVLADTTKSYSCLIEEIAEDKQPVSVDVSTSMCILDDSEEIKQRKIKLIAELESKQNEINKIEKELINKKAEVIDLTFGSI